MMTETLKSILLITLPAILAMMLVLEIVARTLVPTSDVPDVNFVPGIGNHFVPNQTGMYIVSSSSDIKAKYRINDRGWNSPYDYSKSGVLNAIRVAEIGDSFVEALQVDYDKSFPYLLEASLQDSNPGCPIRVHSYGHSGANFAQYVKIASLVKNSFDPHLFVISLVHNDFVESLQKFARIDNWSVRPMSGGFEYVEPIEDRFSSMKRMFRKSALVRYLVVNAGLLQKIGALANVVADPRIFEANVDSHQLESHVRGGDMDKLLGFLLHELDNELTGSELLISMDGDRRAMYVGRDPRQAAPYRLNRLVSEKAVDHSVQIVGLTDWFNEDWNRHRERFDWEIDNHWNQRGHRIAAAALESQLSSRIRKLCLAI